MKDIQKIIDTQREVIDNLENSYINRGSDILKLEKVEDSLKDLRDEKEYFMLLVKDSPKPPTFVHKSRELATIEANRLAKLFGKPVYILKIENVIESIIVTERVNKEISPEDFFNEFLFKYVEV